MSLSPSIPPPPALDSPFTCLSHHPAFATRGRHCPHRRASPAPCAAVGGAAGGDCGPVGARDPRPDPRDPRLRRPRHRQPLGHPQPTHTQTRTRPDARTLTSEPTASPRRAPRPPAPLGCRPAASQPPAAGRPCPSAHPPPPVPLPLSRTCFYYLRHCGRRVPPLAFGRPVPRRSRGCPEHPAARLVRPAGVNCWPCHAAVRPRRLGVRGLSGPARGPPLPCAGPLGLVTTR